MSLSISQAIDGLEAVFKYDPRKVITLVGDTGIGKTQIINQVGKKLNYHVIEYNLNENEKGDFALPFIDNSGEKTIVDFSLDSQLQDVINNPDDTYVIFFDEISKASVGVISETMTLLHNRKIKNKFLPKQTIFVCAMNPSSTLPGYEDSQYFATEMDPSQMNRFTLWDLYADYESFKKYGMELVNGRQRIHPLVLDFLSMAEFEKYLSYVTLEEPQSGSPRAWEEVSDYLYLGDETDLFKVGSPILKESIFGKIGHLIGEQFTRYIVEASELIKYEQVVTNKELSEKVFEKFEKSSEPRKSTSIKLVVSELNKHLENGENIPEQGLLNLAKLYLNLQSEDIAVNLFMELRMNQQKSYIALTKASKELSEKLMNTLKLAKNLNVA